MTSPDREDSTEEDERKVAEMLYDKWGNLRAVKLSFLQRFLQSMQGFEFYRIPLLETGKRAFFYYLKLCLLVGVLSGLVFGYTSYRTAGQVAQSFQEQMPKTTIENGSVRVDAETPYRIQLRNNFEVILDPKAKLNRVRLESNVLAVLVERSLYIRNTPDSFESWPLSTFLGNPEGKTVTITGESIRAWTPFIQRTLFVMSLVIMIIFVIIQTGFWVLIISMGGLIASESESPIFSWSTFLLLSCYAVTPIALAQSFFFVTGLDLPLQRYLLLGGGTLYVYFIVKYLEQNLTEVTYEPSGETPETSNDR